MKILQKFRIIKKGNRFQYQFDGSFITDLFGTYKNGDKDGFSMFGRLQHLKLSYSYFSFTLRLHKQVLATA